MSSLIFQRSKPTEVDLAVPLIYSSGPDGFEYVFKNQKHSAQDFLKFCFVKKGGEFSYDNHYSIYLDDNLLAIGSVFDSKKAKTFTASDAMNIIKFYGLNSFGVIRKGLQVERIIKLPKGNEVAIGHLGVMPEARGKGIGTKLIDYLMKSDASFADKDFVLDVSEENPRAKALYTQLGFKIEKEYVSTLRNQYSYLPDHCRMRMSSSG